MGALPCALLAPARRCHPPTHPPPRPQVLYTLSAAAAAAGTFCALGVIALFSPGALGECATTVVLALCTCVWGLTVVCFVRAMAGLIGGCSGVPVPPAAATKQAPTAKHIAASQPAPAVPPASRAPSRRSSLDEAAINLVLELIADHEGGDATVLAVLPEPETAHAEGTALRQRRIAGGRGRQRHGDAVTDAVTDAVVGDGHRVATAIGRSSAS
jgi:hypothetical protein